MTREQIPMARATRGSRAAPAPDAAVTPASITEALRAGRATPEAVARAIATSVPVGPGRGYAMPNEVLPPPPPPRFASWADWLTRTTPDQKRTWCQAKADKANHARLLSGTPGVRVSGRDVWRVLEAAAGRCSECGSLAVEKRPSGPRGEPVPWASVGRRIGSLGHKTARFHGGDNDQGNLVWTCLWCNTWHSERRRGATDHGGMFPAEPVRPDDWEAPYPVVRHVATAPHLSAEVRHGTRARYRRGCRCPDCRAAQREVDRGRRQRAIELLRAYRETRDRGHQA